MRQCVLPKLLAGNLATRQISLNSQPEKNTVRIIQKGHDMISQYEPPLTIPEAMVTLVRR